MPHKDIKYFICCENVDDEAKGECVDDNDIIYKHRDCSDCKKHKLSKTVDEVQDVIHRRFKKRFDVVRLHYPYDGALKNLNDWALEFINDNNLKERKNEVITKDGRYLWDKLLNAIEYIIENDGNKRKMKTKKWKYSLNVVDKLMDDDDD